jgi:hypothetical protein
MSEQSAQTNKKLDFEFELASLAFPIYSKMSPLRCSSRHLVARPAAQAKPRAPAPPGGQDPPHSGPCRYAPGKAAAETIVNPTFL